MWRKLNKGKHFVDLSRGHLLFNIFLTENMKSPLQISKILKINPKDLKEIELICTRAQSWVHQHQGMRVGHYYSYMEMESWAAAGWSHPAEPSQWHPRSATRTDHCDPVQRHAQVWISRAGSCTRYNHPQYLESCCCLLAAGYSGHISQHQQ